MAVARARCLYCGAELPVELVPTAPSEASFGTPQGSAGPVPDGASLTRVLIVLDLASAPTERLGEALGMSAYEADLLTRRGGFHLHRILGEELAEDEAERLRAAGLKVDLLPESEVRTLPLRALGGERGEGLLELRTEEGPLTLRRREILLVVRGSITRQFQPTYRKRRVDITSLEDGFRVRQFVGVKFGVGKGRPAFFWPFPSDYEPLTATKFVDGVVAGDRVEPSLDVARHSSLSQVLPGVRERALNDIVCEVLVSHHPRAEVVDASNIPLIQRGEGLLVPFVRSGR